MLERKSRFSPPHEEDERPRVTRSERDVADGMREVRVELSVDSQEAALAIATLIDATEDIRGNTDKAYLTAHASWCGGYIAGLVATRNITPEQADTLAELVDRIITSKAHNKGYELKIVGKRGR